MRFVEGGAARTGRLYMPRLDGGLNLRERGCRIADNQLSECTNLWWRDGALRPRPGLRRSAGFRDAAANTGRLISREDSIRTDNGARRVGRRFVERTPGAGMWAAFTLGTLYRDGGLEYSASLSLEGTPEEPMTGRMANSHGLAVDTAAGPDARTLVYFGSGRVYEVKSGGWVDVSDAITIPRLLFGGRGTALPTELPPADGVRLESRNLLTPKFRALYTTDGKATTFFLPIHPVDNREIVVRLTGASGATVSRTVPAGSNFSDMGTDGYAATVDRQTGRVTLINGAANPTAPPYAGPNNLEIIASKTDTKEMDRVFGMTFHTWYGGGPGGSPEGARLFLGGNPRHPHLVHWSAFGDPLYFPEYNFSYIGRPDEAVTGFGHRGDILVVFKERSMYGVDFVLRPLAQEGSTDLTLTGAYFPLAQMATGVGCDAPLTICSEGNRLLWAFEGRVYTLVSVDSNGRGRVRTLSGPVEKALAAQDAADWRSASAGLFGGYYLMQTGRSVYALRAEESFLLRVGRASSDEQAEKQLFWCRWDWDEGVRPAFLLAGEDGAALLGTVRRAAGDFVTAFALDGETDAAFEGDEEREQAVPWRLVTKEYDFGFPEKGKAILSAQMGLTVDNLRPVWFTYVTEAGESGEKTEVPPDGGWLRRMPGCTRARRFGIRVEGSGNAELDGLAVYYRLPG